MVLNAREEILARLKSAPPASVAGRPELPPAREMALDAGQLAARFEEQLAAQGGIAMHAADETALLAKLEEILRQESVSRAMAATDAVLAPLALESWGQQVGIEIVTPSAFSDRDGYTRAVFDQVQAGITGADFAVAESGTLVLVHDELQPRLVSLAPLVHIAVVPRARIVPTYEAAILSLFDGRRPSQVTLITGPSMTADIQATPFKGMHGPQKLFVLLLG
ncbi:MAG: LUD domain-containing protein [Desulfobacterales bacterium]|nr:LUD domain-containing protein [Desulfobacterales bacterium]